MNYLEKYGFSTSAEAVAAALRGIRKDLSEHSDPDVLRTCFAAMDLTTLHSGDTAASVRALVDKANRIPEEFPGCPMPASVCVYPNFAAVVRDERRSAALHVTTVAGCFPSSQSYLSVKVEECRLAVRNGADEIDIVLALNSFLAGDLASAAAEIVEMRKAVDEEGEAFGKKIVLKVILETGLLSTSELIASASLLAMESGADFIKTSTGKVEVNATPEAAYVMCSCIRLFHEKTGRKVGFKAAGGISTAEDALYYYRIVESVLGSGWLGSEYFRLGVSRLGNSLLSAIEKKEIKYF